MRGQGLLYSSCSLFILVTVFSLTYSSNITNVTEGSNVSLSTPDLPSHLTHHPNPPPLLHHPSNLSPSSSPTTSPPVTSPFTAVFDHPQASGVDTSSLAGVAFPIKVQKCCKTNQVLELGQYNSQCVDSTEKLEVDVFLANSTHYWNFTKTSRRDVVVVTNNPCTQSKYFLDPESDQNDTFHVLHNSSLYVPYNMEMFGPDSYCVDLLQTASTFITTAVICTPTPPDSALHFFFGTGLLLSVISLSLLSYYTMWRDDWLDDHKKCLAFFSGTMALSFFFVAISVFFGRYLPNVVNILIAYIVYYLKLNYFIWLTVLCYDTWKCVKTATDGSINRDYSYLKWYMLAAYSIPVLFILVNLIDKYNPALPNLYLEFSYSSSFVWGLMLFYVPNLITSMINIYIMTSIVLPQGRCRNFNEMLDYLQSENWRPAPAPENILQLKNMYRRTFLLCILLLVFLILDLVIFLLPSKGQQQMHFILRDSVYSMQGVIIACMFIRKDCCRRTPPNLNNTETEMNLLKHNDNGLCA